MSDVLRVLKSVISALDLDYTCEHVYTAVAAGGGAALFASLIPGASSLTNIASKVNPKTLISIDLI